jgi:acetolactate synthase-1/2/3 large subunit
MRIADYIATQVAEAGLTEVFMVTGGAAMHLNDAFGREKRLHVRPLHHEQSCTMAADAYSRISGKPAVVNVTAGPGGINALNGVFGAYVDSIPMLIISGQAKRETLVSSYQDQALRQLGDQEVDIIAMVKKITKHAALITDPASIREQLELALFLATDGRHGPCWLDIPIDVQASEVEHANLHAFLPPKPASKDRITIRNQTSILIEKLQESHRPLIYAGSGIRSSGCQERLLNFAEKYGLPIVTAWNNNDLIWDSHPLYAGRPGTVGNRAGNFAVQCCDLLLVLGCRLNIRLISYNWKVFADHAWLCHVDIDRHELDKPTLNQDLKIHADLADFFDTIETLSDQTLTLERPISTWQKWSAWTKELLDRYPVVDSEQILRDSGSSPINPYHFINTLFSHLGENEIITFADGTACVAGFQAAKIRKGQRLFHNSGCASMGFDLPAAIGAHYASKRRVFCIAGDGSLMMNIQELAIIAGNNLPITLFILDNRGYHSIRQTQANFFPGNPVGCGEESHLPFPDFERVGSGFGIKSLTLTTNQEVADKIPEIINSGAPLIVVIKLDLSCEFSPKVTSKRLADGTMVTARLEDMSPFLPRDEFDSIMATALAI